VGAGVNQGMGFSSPEIEKARACFYALKIAWDVGFEASLLKETAHSTA